MCIDLHNRCHCSIVRSVYEIDKQYPSNDGDFCGEKKKKKGRPKAGPAQSGGFFSFNRERTQATRLT